MKKQIYIWLFLAIFSFPNFSDAQNMALNFDRTTKRVFVNDAEIRANMHQELVGNKTNLAPYYKFDAISGTTLTDISSHSNTGTLLGMADTAWTPSAALFYPIN